MPMPKVDTNFITVNGQNIKCPSECTITLNDISKPDAGRDESGEMYKGYVTRKTTLQLSWNAPTPEEAHAIVHAFSDNEYFDVTYYDPYYCSGPGERRTATFYRGDVSAPVYWWYPGRERFSKLSFNIIEK